MNINKLTFEKEILKHTQSIKDEFFDKYIVSLREIDNESSLEIEKLFSKLIDTMCHEDLNTSLELCSKLTKLNIEIGIPYVVLIHELSQLQKIMVNYVSLEEYSSDIYTLHQLNLRFEEIVAQNYLNDYVELLLSKNNRRISSLNDIYEKNIVHYYKAHLKWLSNLAKCVGDSCNEKFPELDHTLCSFGKWLNSDGKMLIQNNSKYNEIVKQHQSLHYVATKIKDLIAQDNVEYHIVLTYLEKCELISLSLGTELALVDNTLINSQVSKDPLTGALNRLKLSQIYANQYEVALATSQTSVFALCDLDHFKKINDTYGHIAGDKILRSFVDIARMKLRSSDIIIRYGGEEFIILLPALSYKKGIEVLENLRKEFEEFVLTYDNQNISTSVSIGVIEVDTESIDFDFSDIEETIALADKKLYKAKLQGRNMVV